MSKTRMPNPYEVVQELLRVQPYAEEGTLDEPGLEVRLQVYPDGQWALRWGASDYDQDHRGYWGSSGIDRDDSLEDLRKVALDLIQQAEDMEDGI